MKTTGPIYTSWLVAATWKLGLSQVTLEDLRHRYLTVYGNARSLAERLSVMEDIQKTASSSGLDAWTKFAEGMVAWLNKRHEEALRAFEGAIELDPEFAYPWHGKGNVLRGLKRYEEALSAYDRAIEPNPEFAYPWYGKGNALRDLERYEEALSAYDRAIELDPEDAYPWNGKGDVLGDLERYEEALSAYDRAIELDPEDAYPWDGKGIVLRNLIRYEEALSAYDRAIKLDPKYAAPWHNKAITFRDLNDHESSRLASLKAVELDPRSGDYRYGLGRALFALGQHAEARDAFRSAIDLGLDVVSLSMAEMWLERASLRARFDSTFATLEAIDRGSDQALLTTYLEDTDARANLSRLREEKLRFKREFHESLRKEKSGADNMLLVLRDWNSSSPLLRKELRSGMGKGPSDRLGGGYLLIWKGHGIVIDPGVDFVTQLYERRKGLSMSDVQTVIVTHCHLDHTRDLETIVDLNYRFNQALGRKPDDPHFRTLRFLLNNSALAKFREYLELTKCCDGLPLQLVGGERKRITDHIDLEVVSVKHRDISGRDNESIGLVFLLKDEKEKDPVLRVGITSDCMWTDDLPEGFMDCHVLVAHLGTVEVGEETRVTPEGDPDVVDELRNTELSNHLGLKGCFRLMHAVQPKLMVISEFGEELVETRFHIIRTLHKLKPDPTRFVLGGDSNLSIGLGDELSVCCSHPDCAGAWTRISMDKVHPFLGGDQLFHYHCSRHGLDGDTS